MSRVILPPLAEGGIVGVDADGVLIDVIPPWCEMYNEEYDDQLRPEQVTDWNMASFVKPECGGAVYRYLKGGALYERARPVEGAAEGVAALREMGLRVLLVTSSFDGQGDTKREWLRAHGFLPGAKEDPLARDLCQWTEKHLLPLSLLIDDYIGNLEPIRNFPAILFPAPYNEQHRENGRFPRADGGWREVVEMVKDALERGRELARRPTGREVSAPPVPAPPARRARGR